MLLITGARLGQLYGRRRLYIAGVAGFTLMSLACGLAPDAGALVAFRVAQGAATAMLIPQVMSVIQVQFTGAARARALSAYGAVLSAGAVLGMVAGGVLVSANLLGETWRPIFLINVPLGAVLLVAVPRLVPDDRRPAIRPPGAPAGPGRARRLDLAGLTVAAAAVCLLVLPLVLGREAGWPPWAFGCLAAGLALAAAFPAVERRVARRGDPLLNLAVLRAPGLAPGLITLALMQAGYGGFLFFFSLHLQAAPGQGGLGDSALRAGLTYLPMTVTFGAAGMAWHRLRGQHLLPAAGMALCTLAYAAFADPAAAGGAGLTWLAWLALAAWGTGMGLAVSPLLTLALRRVPPPLTADASGVLTTTVQLSQVTGVAVFGSVFLALAPATAFGTTSRWLAASAALAVIPALALARAARPRSGC
ncbi:MAG TPA: MFS transporter [Streptosporangiaceae bacterium]|nr:MFS transporter [Streptosporangiaceae bacterium]